MAVARPRCPNPLPQPQPLTLAPSLLESQETWQRAPPQAATPYTQAATPCTQAATPCTQVAALQRGGVPVRTDRSASCRLHHKFCVVDGGPLLAHGSFNWSGGAARGNHENLILSRCPRLASRFATEFERLWLTLDPSPPPTPPPTPPPAAAVPLRNPTVGVAAAEATEVLFFPEARGSRGAHVARLCAELEAARRTLDVGTCRPGPTHEAGGGSSGSRRPSE